MSNRTALLFGATGLVGGHVLDLLLGDDSYGSVIAFVRRNLEIDHPKLRTVVIDFERIEEYSESMRGDDLFCCLGTTIKKAGSREAFFNVDFTYPHRVAGVASRNGVGQFLLVSSMGANASSAVFYNQVKGKLEDAVRNIPFDGIQIFRPSLLLGDRKEFRLGEKIGAAISTVISPLMLGALRKYRPIQARDVATAMITVAERSPGGANIYESDAIADIAGGKR